MPKPRVPPCINLCITLPERIPHKLEQSKGLVTTAFVTSVSYPGFDCAPLLNLCG